MKDATSTGDFSVLEKYPDLFLNIELNEVQ
jgi:hypothetical protein